jgi:hypothetical protein
MTEAQTVTASPAPLTGSQRVKLARQRKRKDIVFVGIEVLPTERDALIQMGLLNKVTRNDKAAVRDALYAFFESHLDVEIPSPTSP